jgi:hypothetical protein
MPERDGETLNECLNLNVNDLGHRMQGGKTKINTQSEVWVA